MLFKKNSSILITIFAIFVFFMTAASNASAQDLQMAQQKQEQDAKPNDIVVVQQDMTEPVFSPESIIEDDDLSGFDFMLGIGFANYYALPGYVGASYQFADFYRMMVDVKMALFAQFMFSADWMHMFEFYGNKHISLSVGAGIGYLVIDKITIRFDGSYDEDDEDFAGRRGIVFPAAFAFDWHTSKTVSLRVLADFNNYVVLEDKRDSHCRVPRYEFHYDVIFQAVIHI